jgi:hypothetical protein
MRIENCINEGPRIDEVSDHSALLSIDLPCFVSSCFMLLMKVMVFPVIFTLHTECVMSL